MGFLDSIFYYTFQRYLDVENEIDSRVSPGVLIKELQNKKILSKFIQVINRSTSNSMKLIRRYHICGLLATYWSEFTEIFLNEVRLPQSSDKWLNVQLLEPYHNFIRKCASSQQQYLKCKKITIKEGPFDNLFFSINLLKLLLKSMRKTQLLGKFYKKKNEKVVCGIIEMIAVQAKEIYQSFKSSLILILQDSERYIVTKDHEVILKEILMNDLALINEEMKFLFLNKEFYPYGKSIGIKLFRTDEATKELEEKMNGIVTDHIETNRRLEKQQIESKLFDGNQKGGFNVKYFEQSLSGSGPGMFAFGRKEPKMQFVDNQDLDIDEDSSDEERQKPKEPVRNQVPKQESLAETNESNLHKLDEHI